MSKQVINLTSTGLVIGDITVDWCKKLSDGGNVSVSNLALEERGSGIYILDNPDVTEDSDFRVHETATPGNYAVGVFSPADGDIARQSLARPTLLGANVITFETLEADLTPIPDVAIIVRNAAGSTVVNVGHTDVNGSVNVPLDDGTYNVVMIKHMVQFTVPQVLVVAGVDATETYTGTLLSYPAPASPSETILVVDLIDIGVQVAAGIAFNVKLKNVPKAVSGNIIDPSGKEFLTDAAGHLEITLARGCVYVVTSQVLKGEITVDATTAATVVLADII